MNYICTYFKLLLLFGVSAAFISCEKNNSPEDSRGEHEEYFEGKINGQEFEPDGNWNCPDIYGTYYPDGYLDHDGGYLTFTIKNCLESEALHLGKVSHLTEGVFESVDTTDSSRPWCIFSDYDYDFEDTHGYSSYLNARSTLEIRLEITNIEYLEEHDDYYIEGLLDAVVQDTIVDSTIVISDVKFGYTF
jgi:hypothetical protein